MSVNDFLYHLVCERDLFHDAIGEQLMAPTSSPELTTSKEGGRCPVPRPQRLYHELYPPTGKAEAERLYEAAIATIATIPLAVPIYSDLAALWQEHRNYTIAAREPGRIWRQGGMPDQPWAEAFIAVENFLPAIKASTTAITSAGNPMLFPVTGFRQARPSSGRKPPATM